MTRIFLMLGLLVCFSGKASTEVTANQEKPVVRTDAGRKAVEGFLDALIAGDTDHAYQLWKPSPSYTKMDFLADWGPKGFYAPIKSYKILKATLRHDVTPNVVDIQVAVSPISPMPDASNEKNRKTGVVRIVSLWVLMSDKSICFSQQ